MGIGVSIFLIALGAILTFATNFRVAGVDVDMVGIILMIVGAIGLVVYLVVWAPRRRREGTVVDEQRRVYDDRPPM